MYRLFCHFHKKVRLTLRAARRIVVEKGEGWGLYECPHCGDYHVTSRKKGQKRRPSPKASFDLDD